MKVRDLIELLGRFDQDADVILDGHGDCDWRPLRTVSPCWRNDRAGGGVFLTTASDDDVDELNFDDDWDHGDPVDVVVSPTIAANSRGSGAS